jgi:exopolyphosphatase/guanosine-5'-triphosphate,3'-diphosphate pyrophosphatase
MYSNTAVIDIGSNSVRLVIYQQKNKYEFNLIYEKKAKVRIGEGAYREKGHLQLVPMQRAYQALLEFTQILKTYPNINVIAVATSALRDAPNKKTFTEWIRNELQLTINIIDGHEEAEYGAIAALTLLPIGNGISIDIGGGSSDLALIRDSKIIETYSLNLGTVRIKELFSDRATSKEKAIEYVSHALESLPSTFYNSIAIGIGGTARTLSKSIMYFQGNKAKTTHGFKYTVSNYHPYFDKILDSDDELLRSLKISKNRIDTIREGTLIWQSILKKLKVEEVIGSAVGIREGVFLKNSNLMGSEFPIKFRQLNS